MKLKRSFNKVLIIAVISILAMLISCAREVKREMFVCFYTGTVTQTRNGTAIPIEVKGIVQEGDLFTVGEKSTLILQSSDGLVIRCESNTEAVISSITDVTKREITLNKGKLLSSVDKLTKGHGYAVKTPTAVASVRGTQFLTEYDGAKTIVAVGRGVVSVKRTAGAADEKLTEKGNTAVVEAEKEIVELRELNKVETLELAKLEKTPVVEQVEKKTPEQMKDVFKDTEKTDEEINSQIEEVSGLSPAEMKAKYGRIDVITLYSGRMIQGVIISRGESYRILTTNGTINVKAKDVRRTDIR
ncbi:MAG TPA: FecR family protein [Spirochaetota bacterium]|nr:FecR family protein [Spirochaetota bacterium]HPJ42648.1 FecR family protein [Spirochaetota bacterium]HPR37237.1 FecR family protein [Spirochaetota bacterium]